MTHETDKEALMRLASSAVQHMAVESARSTVAIAGHLGIHATDVEALHLIVMRGTVSAGELAKATGLTSGSVTALIDRLARKGHVARHTDPRDRRKTLVRCRRETAAAIAALRASWQNAMFKLWSEYKPEQLELICDFLTRSAELQTRCRQDLAREDAKGTLEVSS